MSKNYRTSFVTPCAVSADRSLIQLTKAKEPISILMVDSVIFIFCIGAFGGD